MSRLKKIGGKLAGTYLKMFDFGWRFLPLKKKITFIESHPVIGKLDWSKKEIFLKLSSLADLRRSQAEKTEPETVRWITEDIRSGDVLYDIGASVGAYAFIAAKNTDGMARVYAFEPVAASFAELVQNLVYNNLSDSVIALNVALASETRFVPFSYASLNSGSTKHPGIMPSINKKIVKELGTESSFIQQMQVWSLDDLVEKAKLKSPTHIKIDVDGSEIEVLKGARWVLRSSGLRLVQVEVRKGPHGTIDEVVSLMKAHGFSLREKNRDFSLRAADYVFVK